MDCPDGDRTLRKVLIVGASLAGGACAARLRSNGFTGELTILDPDPDAPYDRPPLSKDMLKQEHPPITTPPGWWTTECEVLRGRARSLDARNLSLDMVDLQGCARRLSGDAIVLACGARPRTLPDMPEGVHVLRSWADARNLRQALDAGARRAAVIGAGVLGCEIASSLRDREIDVTLLDMAPLPLARLLGDGLGRLARDWISDAGVHLRLGCSKIEVSSSVGGTYKLVADKGFETECDIVIAAIGVARETDWLEDSCVRCDNGVLCTAAGEVLDMSGKIIPGLYAAGDVCARQRADGRFERAENWTSAKTQGEAVADALSGHAPDAADESDGYFWTDLFGRRMRIAGTPRPGSELRCRKELPARNGALYELYDPQGHAAWVAVNCPHLLAQAQAGLLGDD